MRRIWRIMGLLILMLCFFAIAASAAEDAPAFDGYIVKFSDARPQLLGGNAEDFIVVETLEAAAEIPSEWVEYIEPNHFVELFAEETPGGDPEVTVGPNDPYFKDYQWSLQEVGALAAYRQGLTAENVKIGVIDSGVLASHEDLNTKKISGMNFNSDGLEYSEDTYGHGTFVTGVIAAQTDNGLGLAGIAPDAELKIYRVFSEKSSTISAVVQAIKQAMADGCRVINLSFGTTVVNTTLNNAVADAVAAGVTVVAAVGNSGSSTLQYPAACPGVIGVGSVDSGLTVSSFSQKNSSVFVTAPGGGVPGLDYTAEDGYRLDLSASGNKGTSYSAPFVAAMAAIAYGYDEDIRSEGIRYLFQTSSTDCGAEGYDISYGHGVVNMLAFLAELTREYSVCYELDGGTLVSPGPARYRVTDEDLPLPIPTREGYQFAGWFLDSGFDEKIEEIAAGSIGDLTLYAAWQENSATAVAELTVQGYPAAEEEEGVICCTLPYGSEVSSVMREDITIVPVAGAFVENVKQTGEQSWSFTVTSTGKLQTSRHFILQLDTALLHVKAGTENKTGTAAPPSLDGNTAAESWSLSFDAAAAWFALGDGTSELPADFCCIATVAAGAGTVIAGETGCEYIPGPEDAEKTLVLRIHGVAAGETTPDFVTVTLEISALPPSNSVCLSGDAAVDVGGDAEAGFVLRLYGNTVSSVLVDDYTLSEEDYTLTPTGEPDCVRVSLKNAALTQLETQRCMVRLQMSRGNDIVAPLRLMNTAVRYDVAVSVSGGVNWETDFTGLSLGSTLFCAGYTPDGQMLFLKAAVVGGASVSFEVTDTECELRLFSMSSVNGKPLSRRLSSLDD